MQFKKICIENLSFMIVLWFALLFGFGLTAGFTIIIFNQILGLDQVAKPSDYVFMGLVFLLYFIVLIIWKKATFRRINFIKLIEPLGVNFISKLHYYSLIEVIGVYSFVRGYWDNLYVAAKMDLPFFAYAFFPRISIGKLIDKRQIVMTGGNGPGYMKEESCIELFSLIKGPCEIDVAIKLEVDKNDIPVTGCLELDEILKEHLMGVRNFNARLIFNRECLRLTIIGGSWEGRKFGEKIQKGFEMFKQMNDALKIKYPVASWDKYQVKWNRSQETFYLDGQ